jgi:phage terminase large subunit
MPKYSTGYLPRPHQEYLHQRIKRFNVLVCHRRFGKTVFSINEILDRAFRCPRKNPTYAYIAPTYGAAKRISWDYLKDATKDIPGATPNESELKVEIPCATGKIKIMLLGAENPGSLRGIYLDGVVIDEFAECDPRIWSEVVRPALTDRLGWAIFIFTPKGSNHAHEMYMSARKDTSGEWFVAMFKASETNILPKKELESAAQFMSDEEYAQEFECSFSAALVGAYYKNEMKDMEDQKRITRVPYDPHCMVHTGWDLGIDDSTAIWFMQEVGRELHAIEYLEVNSKGLDWIVGEILKKKYVYGWHYLPHDAAARELGTGKTRIETLKTLGLKQVEVVKKLGIEDGVHAVRSILPRMWMDRELCAWGVDALKSYERIFDHKEQTFKARPRHNWASHGADGMRTFAVGFRGDRDEQNLKDLPSKSESDYDVMGW